MTGRTRILLLGGSGFVGTAFRRSLDGRNVQFRNVRRTDCNYYDPFQLDDLVAHLSPDFLINAAGFTGRPNVDACELQKTQCLLGNAVLPGIIRDVCERRGLPWGHVSSGCIYTGTGPNGRGYRECDAPNFSFRQDNCSFYSGTKALGEEILNDADKCYVWRLRIPFDHIDSSRNYLSKLMRYDRLLDVRNSLSHLGEVVEACLDCWWSAVDFGIYNLTNTGSITTREVVELIRRSGVCVKDFKFFSSEVEFIQEVAKTPRSSCVLDNQKARDAGLRLSHVIEAIERSLRCWQPERACTVVQNGQR